MTDKCFKVGRTVIPVTVREDGSVNVGATGDISATDFSKLAWAVICEHNNLCGNFRGFVEGGKLETYNA